MALILERIGSPSDVKSLSSEEKDTLCSELRNEIIETVSKNGGHLASNLGVVELTVALFNSFDIGNDKVIFDVGHQCYSYKMLTGRYKDFKTLRTKNGISGFPDIAESVYDSFTTGHSSASVSSALGIALADNLDGKNAYTIAVIGDGSLTGGLAFEGLNNASRKKRNLIIVLNDNNMSISKNVGAVARHLTFIRASRTYLKVKYRTENILGKIPLIGRGIARIVRGIKDFIKRAFYKSTIFEDMGFAYYGPYDGHNISLLSDVFKTAKTIKKPVIIHVKTVKGKGYEHAEDNPKDYHGVPKFDLNTGDFQLSRDSFSAVFGNTLTDMALKNNKICAVTAAMGIGTGLNGFSETHKDRFFDVGIAEAHAVTFSAGLARGGFLPVFAVYSTFLQRAYDSIMHDVALQNLKLILAVDRAGFVGDDGKTHHGLFDVSFLKTVPKITIYSPTYFDEVSNSLYKAVNECTNIVAVRYPRGTEGYKPTNFTVSNKDFDIIEAPNAKICVVCYGRVFQNVAKASEKFTLPINILKLTKIHPIPDEVFDFSMKHNKILFIEEAISGIACIFSLELLNRGYNGSVKVADIKNPYIEHMSMDDQMAFVELDEDGILKKLNEFI